MRKNNKSSIEKVNKTPLNFFYALFASMFCSSHVIGEVIPNSLIESNNYAFSNVIDTNARVKDYNDSVTVISNALFISQDKISVGSGKEESNSANIKSRKIINVTAGDINQSSNEVIVGAQLYETNKEVTRIAQGQIDSSKKIENAIESINIVNSTAQENNSNVTRSLNSIQQNSSRIDNLKQQSHKDRRQARAGTAGAMAMTQITPVQGKTFTVGAGMGTYRNETAVAVGAKYVPKQNVVISLSGSADSRGGVGAATGVSLGFK